MDRVVGSVDARGKPRVQTVNDGESMTQQSDAREADIRHILRRYREVGLVEHLNQAQAVFKDVSQFTDLGDALRQARLAEESFMKLPSKVREIFGHDVAEWLDTAHDPEKRNELVAKGFLEDPSVPVRSSGAPDTGAGDGSAVAAGGTP